MDDIVFFFILGVIQGILEWLPVSSSGNITLVLVSFYEMSFSEAVKVSFFLHAGTMLSVVVKYRSQVLQLAKNAFSRKCTPFLKFYSAATAVSAVVGIPLYFLLEVEISEYVGSLLIAFFLVITGIVIRIRGHELKSVNEITMVDAVVVGIAQGVAVIPGVSRSGLTVSALLSRGVNQDEALQSSFLLSIPPVLGLMILSFSGFSWVYAVSLVSSFVFSLLAMEVLLKTAQKLDFSWFCFAVAVVTVLIVGVQVL